ncbi:MAG: hypothetical protein ACRDD4_12435 [Culicoidibacterales bacterium]
MKEFTAERNTLNTISGKYAKLEVNITAFNGGKPKFELRQIKANNFAKSFTLTEFELKEVVRTVIESELIDLKELI